MVLNHYIKKNIKSFIGIVLVIVFGAGGLYFYYIGFEKFSPAKNIILKQEIATQSSTKEKTTIENSSKSTSDKSGDDGFTDVPQAVMSKSENYQMKEISFGGYEASADGQMKNVPLQISNIRSEVLTSRDGKEAKLLVSWRTNKLAKSEIFYSKAGGESRKISEEGAGFSHALVIGKFELNARYIYSINARDKYGELAKSEEFAAYASKKSESVTDIITEEFKKIFSWTKT